MAMTTKFDQCKRFAFRLWGAHAPGRVLLGGPTASLLATAIRPLAEKSAAPILDREPRVLPVPFSIFSMGWLWIVFMSLEANLPPSQRS